MDASNPLKPELSTGTTTKSREAQSQEGGTPTAHPPYGEPPKRKPFGAWLTQRSTGGMLLLLWAIENELRFRGFQCRVVLKVRDPQATRALLGPHVSKLLVVEPWDTLADPGAS